MSEETFKKNLAHFEDILDQDERSNIAALLDTMRESHIAEIIEVLDTDKQLLIFELLDNETAAEVLEKVDVATRSELFDNLEEGRLNAIISKLSPEDAVDILSEMDDEDSAKVLNKLPYSQAAKIRSLMKYSEDSAGGIMDLDVLSVQEDATVGQAVAKIRQAHIEEDFFTVFVIDSEKKLIGDVRIRYLITADEDSPIKNYINPDTITVRVDMDQEAIRNIFSKNDLIVVPVVDEQYRLVGRITADRVIEVAEEEAAEDIYTMAGTAVEELEDPSIIHAARIRMTWLLPCMVGTAITASLVLIFKNIYLSNEIFYIYTTAIAFMPMIAAISGNAGLQTSAIVVSGLASGHLADLQLTNVFMREARIALFIAIACGIIGGLICGAIPNIFHSNDLTAHGIDLIKIAAAFSMAMFSAIMVATSLGLLLPFLFKKIGIDPAISSGPLVTTANDSISVAIYLSLTLLLT